MKLIKPSVEYIPQDNSVDGMYRHIERCGRICYKSEDKISEYSHNDFVGRMIKSGHTAMLEHGTVYLKIPGQGLYNQIQKHTYQDYVNNKYSKVCMSYEKNEETDLIGISYANITTNLRVLVENDWLDDLKYICEPTEYHEKRYTFRVTTSIGVTREFNRHRTMSIAEQSTRYCNYSKDKFGGEITFCLPRWIDNLKYITITPEIDTFLKSCEIAEHNYLELINKNWKPQQAREVLPLCTATEAIYTAFTSDWQHFFELRYFGTTGAPHPNMLELSELIGKELIKHKLWNEIYKQNIEKC